MTRAPFACVSSHAVCGFANRGRLQREGRCLEPFCPLSFSYACRAWPSCLHELSALRFVHLTCCPLSRARRVCSGNVTIETSFFDDTLLVAKAVMRLYYD